MNFDYSYRAFLITSLLFGILFTILFGIKLKSEEGVEDIENNVIEINPEMLEDVNLAQSEEVAIETNRAFNEAEQFIRQLENERVTEETEETEEDDAMTENPFSVKKPPKKKTPPKKTTPKSESTSETATQPATSTKTTIKYHLVGRTALDLPNPVYICDSGGIVVITIEVNDYGKVVKAYYNKSASTTENGCLIDSALEYANASYFTTKADKKKQLGSITYSFPGQSN